MEQRRIGAAKFKAHCLALLDELTPEGLIVTKHGKPVARVTPYPPEPGHLIGSLGSKIEIHGDVLTTGVTWDAEA